MQANMYIKWDASPVKILIRKKVEQYQHCEGFSVQTEQLKPGPIIYI